MERTRSSDKKIEASCEENLYRHALLMTEIGLDMKERYLSADKCLNDLRSVLKGAEKSVNELKRISASSLKLAGKTATKALSSLDCSKKKNFELKHDYEKLLKLIDRQIKSDSEEYLNEATEMIKSQKSVEHTFGLYHSSSSSRSVKIDVDEKYPESLSRESLIDLHNVLPTVPEDSFSGNFLAKPTRSSSLSSLKSMRKVKLFLQRAENSDEDPSDDEHDFKLFGDFDEYKLSRSHSSQKKHLGNIKEETQD